MALTTLSKALQLRLNLGLNNNRNPSINLLGFFCLDLIMKVQFLKHHLDNKVGDVVEVTEERANYFIKNNVAIKYVKKETKELKPKLEKK